MKEIEIHFKGGDGKRIKTLPEVPDNNDYVDLLTPQDIDGKKNFIQTPTINEKDIATQEKLDEVSNSKQNTLTAGNGISIENDTISVTDAGGLTVLPYGNLDADTTAKVFANPQNYCVAFKDNMCYYGYSSGNKITFYSQQLLLSNTGAGRYRLVFTKSSTGTASLSAYDEFVISIDNTTIRATGSDHLSGLYVKAIRDTTDNSVKTGTEIRKAITIRKWH